MIAMKVETHIGSEGSTPNGRMAAAGYSTPTGENVFGNASSYSDTPWEIDAGYEIDGGTPDLGHRLSIMEWDDLGEVEIGVANQAIGPWNVEDFGSDQTPPLLTGAVFVDNAKTGFYVSGEGVGGYTVTAPGASSYYAVTVASGAYTLPLDLVPAFDSTVPAPTVTVNFTDPSGNVTTQSVTLTHTDGPGQLVYEDRKAGNVLVVRYDNAASDLVLTGVNSAYAAFFDGQSALNGGVYYLAFPNENYFGYYTFLPEANYLYHFDMGYEYVFDAHDGKNGVYLYDFKSNGFFYPSPTFPFPYLYDFNLNSVVYYYPNPNNGGHYNTNGVRYFYVFSTGQITEK